MEYHFLSKLADFDAFFPLDLVRSSEKIIRKCSNLISNFKDFDIKFQGFWWKTTKNDTPHFPQLNDKENFIGYLESSDEDDEYEWSHDISTTNTCGDIAVNSLSIKN